MKKFSLTIIILLLICCIGEAVFFGFRINALSSQLHSTVQTLNQESEKRLELEKKLEQLQNPETEDTGNGLKKSIKLKVKNIPQNPELPNGCEITSATIALNYLGLEADKEEMADIYLPKGEPYWEVDPEELYMGDPRSDEGWYCLTGPIEKAINNYLRAEKIQDYYAEDITGVSVEGLKELLSSGHPVIFWATVNFNSIDNRYEFRLPDGSFPYTRLHCMVLTGYDKDNFYLADPLELRDSVDIKTFTPIFEGLGRRAVVIREK